MGVNVKSDGSVLYAVETEVLVFATLAQMRGFPEVDNSNWTKGQAIALLLGSTLPFDGPSRGVFVWSPTSLLPDDGQTAVKPDAVTVGRWVVLSNINISGSGGFVQTIFEGNGAPVGLQPGQSPLLPAQYHDLDAGGFDYWWSPSAGTWE